MYRSSELVNQADDARIHGSFQNALQLAYEALPIAFRELYADCFPSSNYPVSWDNAFEESDDPVLAATNCIKELDFSTCVEEFIVPATQRIIAALNIVGNTLRSMSLFRRAIYCFDQIIALCGKIEPASSLIVTGNASCAKQSLEYLESLLQDKNKIGVNAFIEAGKVCSNKASLLFDLGQYEQSLVLHDRHLRLTLQHIYPDDKQQTIARNNIGKTMVALCKSSGDRCLLDATIEFIEESLAKLNSLCSVDFSFFERSRGIAQGHLGECILLRALNERENKMFLELVDRALKEFDEMVKITSGETGLKKDPGGLGIALSGKSRALLFLGRDKVDMAIECGQNSYKENISCGARFRSGLSGVALAEAYLVQSNFEFAERELRNVAETFDKLLRELPDDHQRVSIFEQMSKAYILLQYALFQQNKVEESVVWAEQSRAVSLKQLLGDCNVMPKLRPISFNDEFSQILDTAVETQSILLVYTYVELSQSVLIWLIPPLKGNPIFAASTPFDLEMINDMENEMDKELNFRGSRGSNSCNDGDEDLNRIESCRRCLTKLSDALLKPAWQYIQDCNCRNLVMFPQGLLHNIPFAALPVPNQSPNRYLIEEGYTILFGFSIIIFWHLNTSSRSNKNILQMPPDYAVVVGHPYVHEGLLEDFPPLINMKRECERVAYHLNSSPLMDTYATKKAVLNDVKNASIIHFATHGSLKIKFLREPPPFVPGALLVSWNPEECEGSFEQGRDPFGKEPPGKMLEESLYLLDLYLQDSYDESDAVVDSYESQHFIFATELAANIHKDCALVVLGACNCGGGLVATEGVIGFTRELCASGVQLVLASPRKVVDEVTAKLMDIFYLELKNGVHVTKCLNRAMCHFTSSHPALWCSFILTGVDLQ
ncbi:10839_t:CDS:1, partial [Gigaspora rosea]